MSEFPMAERMAKQVKKNRPPQHVSLKEISDALTEGGVREKSLMDMLEEQARYGPDVDGRREALLKLKAVSLIRHGTLDKRDVEQYPDLLVDSDGDAYAPKGNPKNVIPEKGEFLEGIRYFDEVPSAPGQRPASMTVEAARKRATKEKIQKAQEFYKEHGDDPIGAGPPRPKDGEAIPMTEAFKPLKW